MTKITKESARVYRIKKQEELQVAIDTNKCPRCGRPIKLSAIRNWWICSQFGSEDYRAEPQNPPCNWNWFTE